MLPSCFDVVVVMVVEVVEMLSLTYTYVKNASYRCFTQYISRIASNRNGIETTPDENDEE